MFNYSDIMTYNYVFYIHTLIRGDIGIYIRQSKHLIRCNLYAKKPTKSVDKLVI